MIKSQKIHTQTRHTRVSSCKIWGHLDLRKHVSKIRKMHDHGMAPNVTHDFKKIITSKPQMGNPQTLYQNEGEHV